MKEIQNSTHIFLNRIFKGLADALLKVFIPILIYKETGSLLYCFLWATTNYIFTAFLFYALKNFMARYPILSVVLHIFPLIIAQCLLLTSINLPIILLIAIIDGIGTTLYFGGLNFLFGLKDNKTDVSKYETGQHLGKVLLILLSAFILGEVQNSIVFIYIVSTITYIISAIPLVVNYKKLSTNKIPTPKISFRQSLKDNKFFNLYHIFNGIISVFIDIIVPLYLYVCGLSFVETGILIALQELIIVLANYVTKLFKTQKITKVAIIISSIFMGLSLLGIIIFKNITLLYILSVILGFCNQIIFVLLFEAFIKDQNEKGIFARTIFDRDVFLNSSRTAVSALYFAGGIFPLVFGFGIFAAIGMGFFANKCLDFSSKENKKLDDNIIQNS